MRITFGMLTDNILTNLMTSSERLLEAQNRASTGKRIHRPSDDVPAVGRSLTLRANLSSIEQYTRNANVAAAQLSATSSALQSAVSRMHVVRDMAVESANSAKPVEGRQAIATQLDQVMRELADIANTQHLGKYVFAGSKTGSPPVVVNVGDPPYVYEGDSRQLVIQVGPGVQVTATVTAATAFNMNEAALPGADDVFTVIKILKEKVLAGDIEGISEHLADIDNVRTNLIAVNSQVGAQLANLESSADALLESKIRVMDLLSKTEDADLAEAIIQLRMRENLYQAAMATAARVLNVSLVDFLR